MSMNVNLDDSVESLLALSTTTQSSHKYDESIEPMTDKERKQLMEAVQQMVNETDSICQMKESNEIGLDRGWASLVKFKSRAMIHQVKNAKLITPRAIITKSPESSSRLQSENIQPR